MWVYFLVSSFRFQVPIHFVPLSQGDEEQSSGGGMSTAVLSFPLSAFTFPFSVSFLSTPSHSGLSLYQRKKVGVGLLSCFRVLCVR